MTTLYARSDLVYVAVPAENGGCGEPHSRPVIGGAPAKLWDLGCPWCTRVLKDDPLWGQSSLEIPLTPDEERVAKRLEQEGDQVMHQVSAALAKSSIENLRTAQLSELQDTRAAQERSALEDRYRHALAEVERLSSIVGTLQETILRRPENDGELTETQDVRVTKGFKVEASPRISATCNKCGGPLRRPGAKGPTPKGTCLDCRKPTGVRQAA